MTELEKFEALVLAQQPANKPWAPVTDYSFDARREIEGKHPQLIKETFAPKMVIDAGCGKDAILVRLLRELEIPEVFGFDPELIETPLDSQLFRGSLVERRFSDGADEPFADLVICREVLEHLTVLGIRKAVKNLCGLSKRYVYVTTRFNEQPQSWLDVQTEDGLDPTHISMLPKDLLRVLFVLEGFRRRADLEERMDWQGKRRVLVYERQN